MRCGRWSQIQATPRTNSFGPSRSSKFPDRRRPCSRLPKWDTMCRSPRCNRCIRRSSTRQRCGCTNRRSGLTCQIQPDFRLSTCRPARSWHLALPGEPTHERCRCRCRQHILASRRCRKGPRTEAARTPSSTYRLAHSRAMPFEPSENYRSRSDLFRRASAHGPDLSPRVRRRSQTGPPPLHQAIASQNSGVRLPPSVGGVFRAAFPRS